jgi:hypothetical protein
LDDVNAYFVNIATDPDYNVGNIESIVGSISTGQCDNNMLVLNEYEVYRMLSNVKNIAAGHYGLPYWLFRHCALELSEVVTFVFNKLLSAGHCPAAWKKSFVTPVPKVSARRDYSDYRLISVTPKLSRVIERFIVRQYLNSVVVTGGSFADQFAHRPTGSTTAAPVNVFHQVCSMLENNQYVRCLLVDFSRAFDAIDHCILLQKIDKLALALVVKRWIASFLTGRSQAIKVHGKLSKWLRITRTIVQSSEIGPSLYIVFAPDLNSLFLSNCISKYAYDTTLLCQSIQSHSF